MKTWQFWVVIVLVHRDSHLLMQAARGRGSCWVALRGARARLKSMVDFGTLLLLANLALSFYLVGCIWAHEVDIFRSWKLLDLEAFRRALTPHWHKLPYWIFAPLGLALLGSLGLVWRHPTSSPAWAKWGNLGFLLLSFLLTAFMWGRWQASLSVDPLGSRSPTSKRFCRPTGCERP